MKITEQTVVDTNNLTQLEKKVFNMPIEEWNQLEDEILSQFP